MRSSVRVLLIAIFIPLAATAQDEADSEEQIPDNVSELSPEEAEKLFRELKEQRRAFARSPIVREPDEDNPDFSGEWIEEYGSRFCDGYLTRSASEEYCSREIPDDWRSFEFDGETYFVAPTEYQE